jgi:hydroxymethylglutaryl-CoA lyase
MGLANVVAGLRVGIDVFDGSVGGIGGCPFAPRATGNVSTEDTVHMLHEMGIDTGINLDRLIECAQFAERILGFDLPGQVMKAGKRSDLAVA